jgi:hypothetical protein
MYLIRALQAVSMSRFPEPISLLAFAEDIQKVLMYVPLDCSNDICPPQRLLLDQAGLELTPPDETDGVERRVKKLLLDPLIEFFVRFRHSVFTR